jgi:hypothetical protein
MSKAPELDDAVPFWASTSADGSGGVIYDSDSIAAYRYIQIRAE